jgi:hypothetical protein
MKTKQLANILIKILGIYLIVEVVSNSATVIGSSISLITSKPSDLSLPIGYAISVSLQILIAFVLITKSKSITGFLFKGEED